MISERNENISRITEKLRQIYNSGNGLQFWNFVQSTIFESTEIILKSSEFPEILKNKFQLFNNLSKIPWGIAPVANSNIKSLLRIKFNFKRLQEINFQDFTFDFISNEQNQNLQKFLNKEIQKEIVDEIITKFKDTCFDKDEIKIFVNTLILKLEKRWGAIFSLFQHLKNAAGNFTNLQEIDIKNVFKQTMQILTQEFADIQTNRANDVIYLFQKGFIPYQINDDLFLFYGFPGRTEFFRDLIFGEAVEITLNNLFADACKIDFETGERLFFNHKEPVINVSLRKSDNFQIILKLDKDLQKNRNLQDLSKIHCDIDIQLTRELKLTDKPKKKPEKNVKADDTSVKEQNNEEMLKILLLKLFDAAKNAIKKLDLSSVSEFINPEVLQIIAKFNILAELNINNAAITTSQLKPLEGLKALEILRINEIQVDDEKIDLFWLFPKLREIEAQEAPQILKLLGASTNLNIINSLDLSCKNVKSKFLEEMPKMLNLQVLTLSGVDFTESAFKFADNLKSLHSLIIPNSKHSGDSLSSIYEHCSNIVNLDISARTFDITLSSEDFNSIAYLQNLQNLNISGRPVSDSFVQLLSGNVDNLRELNLSYTLISNLSLEYLRRFNYLTVLNLEGCRQITDFGIEILTKNCPKLNQINIKGTSSTESSRALLLKHFPDVKFNV